VIPWFQWPEGTGSAAGLKFYGAMTNQDVSAILGIMDVWEFGWNEN